MIDTSELASLSWCDADFFGFRWQGNDLLLYITLASTDIAELQCHWASDLKADLRWARPADSSPDNPILRGGPLLTWDGSLKANEDGRWVLLLDFAHDGSLELECEKITVSGRKQAAV